MGKYRGKEGKERGWMEARITDWRRTTIIFPPPKYTRHLSPLFSLLPHFSSFFLCFSGLEVTFGYTFAPPRSPRRLRAAPNQ